MALSAEEQLFLEFLNAARLDPMAEAAIFGVDLNDDLPPGTINAIEKQPLAHNAILGGVAKAHSQWQLDNNTLSITGAGGSSVMARAAAAGYQFTGAWSIGESVAPYLIDDPVDPNIATLFQYLLTFFDATGRSLMLNDTIREIGLGQVFGQFNLDGTTKEASILTQDYAVNADGPFLTGVVFNDTNNNGFYSVGEGIGGITVSVGTTSTTTEAAGGYAVEAATGVAQTISVGGELVKIDIGSDNVKVDLVDGEEFRISASTALISGSDVVDNATLLGTKNYDLQGNPNDNVLRGNKGSNTIKGLGGNDTIIGSAASGARRDTIDGGSGIDTLSFTNESTGVDLNAHRGLDHTLISIEKIEGSKFDDNFVGGLAVEWIGGEGNDNFRPGGGAESFSGGEGIDVVSFDDGNSASFPSLTGGVTVDLSSNMATGGGIGPVTLIEVENATGSQFADTISGNFGANDLEGRKGSDTLDGRGGSDVLKGGAGDDILKVNISGVGDLDTLDGGDDIDTADFSGFGSAVLVDLAYDLPSGIEAWTRDTATVTSGAWRGIAEISNVENVTGTAFADRLIGDAGDNRLLGGDGNDILEGGEASIGSMAVKDSIRFPMRTPHRRLL